MPLSATYLITQVRIHVQKGGFRTFRRGGFVQELQERIQIVAGPWANQQAKKLQTAVGGVSDHPKKNPVSAPVTLSFIIYILNVHGARKPLSTTCITAHLVRVIVHGKEFKEATLSHMYTQ